jgi:hypothetical protein
MAGKLHEVLAVEADLEGKAKLVVGETKSVFEKKPALFTGASRTYKPFVEDGVDWPEENQAMATTVEAKLKYASGFIASWFDALAQKEATNQIAKAAIVVDGVTLIEDVPATFLLGLESRLKYIREMYEGIPTLSMSIDWQQDPAKGDGVWSMVNPEKTFKTAKTMKSKVLYEATDKHPAQIEKWDETENVGIYVKHVWSGMITPSLKAQLLERIDKLIRAVKQARQRANSADVVKVNVGKKLMDFINNS